MAITRRELLRRAGGLGALAFLPVLSRCTGPDSDLPIYTYDGPLGPEDIFADGVASGDPLLDSVILWTRVNPGEMGGEAVDVFVEVAEDSAFLSRVLAGTYSALPERGYCLKFDATDLNPGTTYYYRFYSLGRRSRIGRTKTAAEGSVTHLRLGVCACSNYAYGFFHAYWHMSQRKDLDAVLHLGDYIYEYADGDYGGFRDCDPPHEIVTLEDYRARYSQYRRDLNLQEAHRQHPWITVWDDHEFCNNPYVGGADNHQPDTEGDWSTRVSNAIQAYDEWMPTRVGEPGKIYRSFVFGDLVALHMLDIKRPLVAPVDGEDFSMLGDEQANWLDEQIAETGATWMLLGQQQTFATGNAAWDDHVDSRLRIRDASAAAGVRNVVVLTGDIHQARCCDIAENPDSDYDVETGVGSWGVEMVCTSISSPGSTSDMSGYPHKHWSTGVFRGYLILDIRPDRLQGDWFGYLDPAKLFEQLPMEAWQKGWITQEGSNHLFEASEPASEKATAAALAPTDAGDA